MKGLALGFSISGLRFGNSLVVASLWWTQVRVARVSANPGKTLNPRRPAVAAGQSVAPLGLRIEGFGCGV